MSWYVVTEERTTYTIHIVEADDEDDALMRYQMDGTYVGYYDGEDVAYKDVSIPYDTRNEALESDEAMVEGQ